MKGIINILGMFSSFIIALLGGWDLALQILVYLVIIDYISGVMSAIVNKKLSSQIGAKGIVKKVGCFLIVAVAFQIDRVIVIEDFMRTVVIGFYIANEGLSILENLTLIGVPFPQKFKDFLIQVKNDKNGKKKD